MHCQIYMAHSQSLQIYLDIIGMLADGSSVEHDRNVLVGWLENLSVELEITRLTNPVHQFWEI